MFMGSSNTVNVIPELSMILQSNEKFTYQLPSQIKINIVYLFLCCVVAKTWFKPKNQILNYRAATTFRLQTNPNDELPPQRRA